MEKEISLTIEQRLGIISSAYTLKCTTAIRRVFNDFINALEVTDEEGKKYEVKRDGEKIVSNDPTYTRSYKLTDFPTEIVKAIHGYIEYLDEAASQKPPLISPERVNEMTKWFKLLFV